MKKYIFTAVLFIALIIAAGAGYKYLSDRYQPVEQSDPSASDSDTADAVTSAGDFSVYNLNGEKVNLSDYFGKPIVVNFWASWCSPCKAELPDFENAYKTYGDDVEFLMVNVGDNSLNEVNDFINDNGFTFPAFFDKDNSVSQSYNVYSIPVTIFINADSSISQRRVGMLTNEAIIDGINKITGEN